MSRAFLAELRRRKVFRVAVVYAAVAFVIWQAADIAFPALHLPAWLVTAVVALTLLGFPLALVLAWVFDITSAGVVRTDEQRAVVERVLVSRATQRTQPMQHVAAAGGVLVLALAGGAFIAQGAHVLGRPGAAVEALRALDDAGELYTLSRLLTYTFFDPTPFSRLSATRRRHGALRTNPLPLPYACR